MLTCKDSVDWAKVAVHQTQQTLRIQQTQNCGEACSLRKHRLVVTLLKKMEPTTYSADIVAALNRTSGAIAATVVASWERRSVDEGRKGDEKEEEELVDAGEHGIGWLRW